MEEDTGSAGEQPASNTLYGYTEKGKALLSSFSFFRYPYIAKKTQCLCFPANANNNPTKQSSISRQTSATIPFSVFIGKVPHSKLADYSCKRLAAVTSIY